MTSAQKLEKLLVQEWSTDLRLTTIPQAMGRLGMADDSGLRWEVANRLEPAWRNALISPEKRRQVAAALGRELDESQSERLRQQLGTWHLASILLTEDEKLVARYILICQEGAPHPSPADTSDKLGIPVPEVNEALRMLARVGFLSLRDRRRPASYTVAQGYERLLEGLGFSFHTVTLDTGDRFGVP